MENTAKEEIHKGCLATCMNVKVLKSLPKWFQCELLSLNVISVDLWHENMNSHSGFVIARDVERGGQGRGGQKSP